MSYQRALKKKLIKLVNFCIVILILKMEESTQHFGYVMLYRFKKDKNATETHTHTHTQICAVYGEGAVTDQMC